VSFTSDIPREPQLLDADYPVTELELSKDFNSTLEWGASEQFLALWYTPCMMGIPKSNFKQMTQ
jgi:hypothetical protein